MLRFGLILFLSLTTLCATASPLCQADGTVAGMIGADAMRADSVRSHENPVPEEFAAEKAGREVDINSAIDEHLADSYWWHITTYKGHHVTIYLPVIARSQEHGWMSFSSKRIDHGHTYRGFFIATEGKYANKLAARGADGEIYRPWDISITKNVLAVFINCAILLVIFLSVARWYKRKPEYAVPGGFVGAVEMFVMNIEEEVIRPNVGKDYAKFSPYLLTAFFFVLVNNVMGVVPIFPGGANTTGNIAITFILALCTMFVVNIFGNREYWKEIFWPDVPVWMKVPIPLMPIVEFIGIFTKPFALMIRLFANTFAGHAIILSLTFLIFTTVGMGTTMNVSMSFLSVLLTIFMIFLEILVAYIQAYIFTMLSAVFIGLARPEHHAEPKLAAEHSAGDASSEIILSGGQQSALPSGAAGNKEQKQDTNG